MAEQQNDETGDMCHEAIMTLSLRSSKTTNGRSIKKNFNEGKRCWYLAGDKNWVPQVFESFVVLLALPSRFP